MCGEALGFAARAPFLVCVFIGARRERKGLSEQVEELATSRLKIGTHPNGARSKAESEEEAKRNF